MSERVYASEVAGEGVGAGLYLVGWVKPVGCAMRCQWSCGLGSQMPAMRAVEEFVNGVNHGINVMKYGFA